MQGLPRIVSPTDPQFFWFGPLSRLRYVSDSEPGFWRQRAGRVVRIHRRERAGELPTLDSWTNSVLGDPSSLD
jgi:hypothetical protein